MFEALGVFTLIAFHKVENTCIVKQLFLYNTTVQVHLDDPGKGNVIVDSVTTIIPIAFIFTGYCRF